MIEKLKKLGRSITRAYVRNADSVIEPVLGVFIAAGMGGGMGAIISVSLAAMASGASIAVIGVGALMAGVTRKKNKECIEIASGLSSKVIGNRGDVHGLQSTQMMIKFLTKEFKTAAQLPPKAEAKVRAYLQDAAEFAANVRIYDGGQEQDEIVFTREVFNAQGQTTETPVCAVKTAKGLTAAPVVHAQPQPQQGIKVLKPLQYTTNNPKNQVAP